MTVSPTDRQMPRVLVVASRVDIGGTEMHLLRVLPALRRAGLDISLFVLERGGRLERRMQEAGVDILGVGRRLLRIPHAIYAAFVLRGHLRRQRPDILHCFLSEPYFVGALASAGLPGISRIMSRRSLNDYQRKYPALAWLERRLHKRTAILLGNSSAVVADLRTECEDADKIGLIHNGITLPGPVGAQNRAAARASIGLAPDAFVFAVNANLIAYKGHRDLFAALDGIKDRLSRPWQLLLIGRDHGLRAELQAAAAQSGFADRVLWLGERADAQQLLYAADAVVLPSHEEGFSNSLIEAMGRGLAVIATAVGGNVDAVTHEASGLLVPARDPQALGEALLRLYDDEDLRRRLGAAARARVESEFSIEACVGRYLNLYRGYRSYGAAPAQNLIEARPAG